MGCNIESALEAQKVLRNRLCGHTLPPHIKAYKNERTLPRKSQSVSNISLSNNPANGCVSKQLLNLIKRTATSGESNSLLVTGPRGSGKTMLLRSVLEELNQQREVAGNLMQVHLNGLLQTDDRIALKSITQQLALENAVGDRVFGSFAENLQFLLDTLKSGGKDTKSILFVLDEFDLFALHHNQTLLYNLFDVSQSAQTPVCIIGLSARLDVVGLLEKRVKSRFSHRQLHLLGNLDFDGYVDIFHMLLTLPEDFIDRKYAKKWLQTLEELCESMAVKDILRKQFSITKDVRTLHTLLILPVCHVSPNHPFLAAGDFVDSSKLLGVDSKAAMLHGVSVLELCLVIAMKHVRQIYDDEPFNFEMVFREYQKFVRRKSSVQSYEKPVVLKAFEHLCALELVRPVGGSTRQQKEYRVVTLLVDDSQVIDALQSYPGCPTEVRQWGLSSAMA